MQKIDAIDLAFKLINYKKVKVIFLPEGKDVNDIGKKKNHEIHIFPTISRLSGTIRIKI